MWKTNGFIFLLSLLVGFTIGLFVIAWWLFPVRAESALISDLRTDLKIDYVRLVAASYANHGDINTAIERLNLLGNPPEVLELALAQSTETEKNQILQLQSRLPAIVEDASVADVTPTTNANAIPSTRNLYIGYGFLAVCIFVLSLADTLRQGRPALRFLLKSSDMRKRIGTVILLIIIYRFTATIPLTGINQQAARQAMGMTSDVHQGIGGLILSLDVLSGGTFSTFSILSVGIYGYVIASIVVNLVPPMVPAVRRKLIDDQREGRAWMARWTSWGSLLLSIPLSWLLLNLYSGKFAACMGQTATSATVQVGGSNLLGTITIMFEIVAAAKFAEWLADVISRSFRGMGSSIIIAVGIVLGIIKSFNRVLTNQEPREIVIFGLLVIVLILPTVYIIQARRNVPIMYPHKSEVFYAMSRGKAARMPQPVLPIMVGMAGITPVLVVQGLLTLPVFVTVPLLCTNQVSLQAFAATTGAFFNILNPTYWLIFAVLLIPITFLYNDAYFARENYGENLKRSGAQIPKVHSGQTTERYLQRIMRRITLPYALLLVGIAVLPYLAIRIFNLDISPLLGVSIFILVGIIRDGFMNMEAELKLMGYQKKLLIS